MTELNKERLETLSTNKTAEAAAALEWAQGIEVTSEEDLRAFVKGTAVLKEELKKITDQKTELLKPYKDPMNEIGAALKSPLADLTEAEKVLKNKLGSYVVALIDKKNALLEEATADGVGDVMRAQILKEASAIIIPEVPGMSIREEWTGEIESDNDLVVNLIDALRASDMGSFLLVDEKALAKYTKERSEDLDLPGWKCFKKTIITITPSRVEQ